MEQINIKQLREMSAEKIKGAIPFWITADGERIALVIHPSKYELFTRIDSLIKKEVKYGESKQNPPGD